MKVSQDCVELVKHFEGFEDTAYLCPANVWTIGYGRTRNVKEGDRITEPQAERDLLEELEEFKHQVLNSVKVELKQNELEQKMINDEITNESEADRIDSEMKSNREKLKSIIGDEETTEPEQEQGKEE